MDASIGLDELMPVYGSRRSESLLRVVGSDLAPALPWGIFVIAVGIRATLLERRERKPGYDWREAVVIVACGEGMQEPASGSIDSHLTSCCCLT